MIGVCNPSIDETYMTEHIESSGKLKLMKIFPVLMSIDDAQKALDEFAKTRGLSEVHVC